MTGGAMLGCGLIERGTPLLRCEHLARRADFHSCDDIGTMRTLSVRIVTIPEADVLLFSPLTDQAH